MKKFFLVLFLHAPLFAFQYDETTLLNDFVQVVNDLHKAWHIKRPVTIQKEALQTFVVLEDAADCLLCELLNHMDIMHDTEFVNMVHFWFRSYVNDNAVCQYDCDNLKKSDTRFVLMTSLYNETHPERLQEYLYCLQHNKNHPLISTIHVLYDTAKDDADNELLQALQEAGAVIEYIEGRPSYEDFFQKARLLYPDKTIILANGDIFFNYTLFYLCNYSFDNTFMALTRWDFKDDGSLAPFMYKIGTSSGYHGERPATDSQDAWIFKSPLTQFEDASRCLGTLHCDGKIAFQAKRAGCKVINPCLSVQSCHVHNSRIRHYGPEPDISKMAAVNWSAL